MVVDKLSTWDDKIDNCSITSGARGAEGPAGGGEKGAEEEEG